MTGDFNPVKRLVKSWKILTPGNIFLSVRKTWTMGGFFLGPAKCNVCSEHFSWDEDHSNWVHGVC